jgi:hypothetical protein
MGDTYRSSDFGAYSSQTPVSLTDVVLDNSSYCESPLSLEAVTNSAMNDLNAT